MTTTANKTPAQQIAAQLRAEYGLTSRQVSARMSSGGSSIRVEIKDSAVCLADVEKIAKAFERISRDGFGEILSGGNTFVSVDYSNGVMNAEIAKVLPAIEAITERGSSCHPIVPGFMVSVDARGWYQAWGDRKDGVGRCIGSGWDAHSVARAIALGVLTSDEPETDPTPPTTPAPAPTSSPALQASDVAPAVAPAHAKSEPTEAYRPMSAPPKPAPSALSLSDASAVFANLEDIRNAGQEHFVCFDLTVRHQVIAKRVVAIGTLTGVEVHPREVFRQAIVNGAASVIIAHNHPSGDPSPSRQDLELTARLRDVGELCGIALLDHVVVAAGGYISMADRGWLS